MTKRPSMSEKARRGIVAAGAFAAMVILPVIASGPAGAQTISGNWVAETVAAAPAADPKPTLGITAEGEVSGSAGCNRYSGRAEIAGNSITFGPLATTRMACPGRMEAEQRFLSALQRSEAFRLDAGRLVLIDGSGAPTAAFSAQ